MPKFAHRIAFNCDLVFDVVTDSPETTLDELETLALAGLRGERDVLVSDVGFDVAGLIGARVYPRTEMDKERLENLTYENCTEVPNS